MLAEPCGYKPKENSSREDKAKSLSQQPCHSALAQEEERKRHHISYLHLWTSTFSQFHHCWAGWVHGTANIVQLTIQITCPPGFNKNKCSGCIQAATVKIWSRSAQGMWMCLSQPGQILLPSCPASVWAAAGGVPGCRVAPHTAAFWAQPVQMERKLSRVWWKTASAPCVNTRIQTSSWELAFTFYLWLVGMGFFSGCSRQHICTSLDTAFLTIITVPGNF